MKAYRLRIIVKATQQSKSWVPKENHDVLWEARKTTLQGTNPYPTLGKGKSSSNMPWEKDMLFPRKVRVWKFRIQDLFNQSVTTWQRENRGYSCGWCNQGFHREFSSQKFAQVWMGCGCGYLIWDGLQGHWWPNKTMVQDGSLVKWCFEARKLVGNAVKKRVLWT